MIRKILTASVAAAAVALAGPAIAGPGGHGPGGGAHGGMSAGTMGAMNSHAGMNAGVNSQGSLNANMNSALNKNTTTSTTTNPAVGTSQGPNHASVNGIANANSHSVLAGGQVPGSALPGLTSGFTVENSSGATIGTVSQVVTDSSGNIRLVLVTDSATGQTLRLAPNTLTISGSNTVMTSSTVGG